MDASLTFAAVHSYDTRSLGIDLPVSLRSGFLSVTARAKLDTGASHCIFRRDIGTKLGFAIESGAALQVSTVTSSFVAYGHEVTVQVLGVETIAVAYFAADEHFTRNVLGRTGWLDRVRLGLIDHDGELYLSHYNDPA